MNDKSKQVVNLFVKYPEPGKVKTRLAEYIGEKEAAELYKCFVLDTFAKIEHLDVKTIVNIADKEDIERFKKLFETDYQVMPQLGDDLGERMKTAFLNSFSQGYERCVLTGSDLPDLPYSILTDAFDELESKDCCIGPAADGGYYIMGFNSDKFRADVFDEVPWSSEDTFNITMEKIQSAGLSCEILPQWNDVDEPGDLKVLWERIEGSPFTCPYTADFIDKNLRRFVLEKI